MPANSLQITMVFDGKPVPAAEPPDVTRIDTGFVPENPFESR